MKVILDMTADEYREFRYRIWLNVDCSSNNVDTKILLKKLKDKFKEAEIYE